MRTQCRSAVAMVVAGACLAALLPGQADAQKKKPAEEKSAEAQKADDVSDLITAYKLAESGRKNEAPEALITAAGIMRRLSKVKMTPITEKVTVEDDKGGKKEEEPGTEKGPDLAQEANDLFDEAQAMGAKLNVNVDKLIKLAKERPNTRAVVGGPRTINRAIRAHETQIFHFQFYTNQPCSIGFRSAFPMRIQAVRHDYDQIWMDNMTMYDCQHGVPGGAKGGRAHVSVRVHNTANVAGQFQLYVN